MLLQLLLSSLLLLLLWCFLYHYSYYCYHYHDFSCAPDQQLVAMGWDLVLVSQHSGHPARIRFQELGHFSEEVIPDMLDNSTSQLLFFEKASSEPQSGNPAASDSKIRGIACLAVAAASRWIQPFTCTRIPFSEGACTPKVYGWESRSASHSRRKQTVPMQLLSSGHVWHMGCARSKLEDKLCDFHQLSGMLLAQLLRC